MREITLYGGPASGTKIIVEDHIKEYRITQFPESDCTFLREDIPFLEPNYLVHIYRQSLDDSNIFIWQVV